MYVGHAGSVEKRFAQHMAGQVSWTRPRLPVLLVRAETFPTREEAVKRERQLKSGFGRKWVKRRFKGAEVTTQHAMHQEKATGVPVNAH